MLKNLFSGVDMQFVCLKFLSWVFGSLWFYFVVGKFYFYSGSYIEQIMTQMLSIKSEVDLTMKENKGMGYYLGNLFILILGLNCFSQIPLMMGLTTQIFMVLSLGMYSFFMTTFSKMAYYLELYFIVFVPEGMMLSFGSFMSLMELISEYIRPLTLSLRLGAKMTAGHVLVNLLSMGYVYSVFKSGMLFMFLVFIMVGYMIFEMGVSVIQGIVFCLLTTEYSK